MCENGGGGGSGGGNDNNSSSSNSSNTGKSTGWGQDKNGDGKVGLMEAITDMFDGGGRGRNAAGDVYSTTVSDRSTLSANAPVTSFAPISRPENLAETYALRNERDSYIQSQLDAAGLTTSSPGARNAISNANAAFNQTAAGQSLARNEAMLDFHMATDRMPTVDQGLIDLAQGRVAGSTPEQIAKAQRDLGTALVGSKAPGATYDDPFGTAMNGTIADTGSLLGSNIDAGSYFSNVSRGYNNESGGLFGIGGMDLTSNTSGDVGFNTFGQRAVSNVGRMAGGMLLGSINPTLGLAGQGLNVNTMSPYSSQYGAGSTEVSFSPGQGLGGLAFGGIANAAIPAIYNGTGNVNLAIGGGVGLGALGAAATNSLASSINPISMFTFQGQESDTPSSGAFASVGPTGDVAPGSESGAGFSDRVDSGSSNDSSNQDVNQAPPILNVSDVGRAPGGITQDSFVNSNVSADVGSGVVGGTNLTPAPTNQFVSTPVSLTGDSAQDEGMLQNPLFFQSAESGLPGVSYLNEGRQRDTGGITWSIANNNDVNRQRRRSGFGSSLVIG